MPEVVNIRMPYNYTARPYQVAFWEAMKSGKKRAVLVWHRRAGKEKTCWNYLVMKAAMQKGIYYYFFPFFSQARKILWDGCDKAGNRFLDHIPPELIYGNRNNTEMKLWLKNGSLIQMIGVDNIDSIVGTNPVGCVFSEYSLQDPNAWQFIRPILAENDGWAVFNFTPRGQNHSKELFDMAKFNPEWFTQLLTVEDTGVLSPSDIQRERDAGMSEDFIQQEFYCSFSLGIEGSYYAYYMQAALNDKRIGAVPYDRNAKVHTAWDIGYGDSCAIIFFQIIGNEIHIVDCIEDHGKSVSHYIELINAKKYIYGDHFGPHDIANRHFSSGLSTKEVALDLGFDFYQLPTLRMTIEEGIEASRSIFPRVWIDERKCKDLIKALENYRKEFDDRHTVYKEKPLHNWASHYCFVGDTLISTSEGYKRIDSLVTGDRVLTPNGYKKILKVYERKDDNLLTIKTLHNSFTCTPSHEIFTKRGLIHADSLRYNDELYTVKDISECQVLYGLSCMGGNSGFRENFLSLMTSSESYLTDTSSNGGVITTEGLTPHLTRAATCNAPCGLITKGKFLKVMKSIIKMATQKIMRLKTLSASKKEFIKATICEPLKDGKYQGNQSILQCKRPENGTEVLREESGIKSTPKNVVLEKTSFQKYVPSVAEDMSQKYTTSFSARINAKQDPDTSQALTTKKGIAPFVEKHISATNTPLSERVLEIVPLSLPTKQKVYDIEVEDDHCYYANGVLVSNSDAFRYMAIAVKMKVDKLKSGIDDAEADRLFHKHVPSFS